MKTEEKKPAPPNAAASSGPIDSSAGRSRVSLFALCAVVLIGAFCIPLWQLLRLALREEIQSHILLIPFVFLYLWKLPSPPRSGTSADDRRKECASERKSSEDRPSGGEGVTGLGEVSNPDSNPAPRSPLGTLCSRLSASSSPLPATTFALLGSAALAGYWFWARKTLSHDDALSSVTVSFLCFLYAIAFVTLGWRFVSARLFTFAFLIFLVPLPSAFVEFASIALQRASAEAAAWMISLTGMPVLRDDLVFQFAGLAVRVAEECSGIRSTFVLFITSLLAGHLFLRTGWKKALLTFAIFPLGIARNGFRITSISWLSVNVDRSIIEGPLHHRGGPIFFVLSLIPLFALLWLLRRSDLRRTSR